MEWDLWLEGRSCGYLQDETREGKERSRERDREREREREKEREITIGSQKGNTLTFLPLSSS